MTRIITPSQTVGPFFAFCLTPRDYDFVPLTLVETGEGVAVVTVQGRILDGDGQPVPDAFLEVWYADRDGRYGSRTRNMEQAGFARCPTDADGRFLWRGEKPGPVRLASSQSAAPHLNVSIFARGLLDRLVTRIYFDGDSLNDSDPLLGSIDPARRKTLIAKPEATSLSEFGHTIHLQGDKETVFFAI